MNCKLFEIRDRATFIPVLAIGFEVGSHDAHYLLRRSGYRPGETHVIMMGLAGGRERVTCDPYDWCDRTRTTAHKHIIEHWKELKSGDVVDVQFILGETVNPKESE